MAEFLIHLVRRGWPARTSAGGLLLAMLGASLSMTGCSSPVTLYHQAEGGDIAARRQAPPGADLPYPNLASVPASPAVLTANQRQAVQEQLLAARAAPTQPAGTPAPASAQALAGLELPGAAPPLPNVPGIEIQRPPPAPPPIAPAAPAPVAIAKPDGPPILLAFQPKSALLSSDARTALMHLASARGSADIRVAGFGEAKDAENGGADARALTLALRRARRIADALTAAGVPARAITLTAVATGSGGFAQLVY